MHPSRIQVGARTHTYPALTGAAEAVQAGAGAVYDDDAVKTQIATSTSAVEYTGAALNGVVGQMKMSPRRGITVATAAVVGAYELAQILVTGEIDRRDGTVKEVTAAVTLTDADGGETFDFPFPYGVDRVTKINIAAMADTDGSFKFGVGDIYSRWDHEGGNGVPNWRETFRALLGLAAGNVKVGFTDGTTDIIPTDTGRLHYAAIRKVFRAGTTAAFQVT